MPIPIVLPPQNLDERINNKDLTIMRKQVYFLLLSVLLSIPRSFTVVTTLTILVKTS